MQSNRLKDYLAEVCRDLDRGQVPRRFDARRALLPFAIPAALGFGGLVLTDCGPNRRGTDAEEVCTDEADNDDDELVDCLDPDCFGHDPCMADPEYGAPFEGEVDCTDSIDNDMDGMVDCADPDCLNSCPQPAYGVPFETETECDDGVDNDADGMTDCADSDCSSLCGQTAYGVPFEGEIDCSNGADDDGDGAADCCDEDCEVQDLCLPSCPWYGAPLAEEACGDCIDDDCDGQTDCDDEDCEDDPLCGDDQGDDD